MNNLEEFIWEGHIVRVPPIELQLQANKIRGRRDRVRTIEKYIAGLQ